MKLAKGTVIAVVDGAHFETFGVAEIGSPPTLSKRATPDVTGDNKSSGARHGSSSANPDDSRLEEDSHVVAVVDWLNGQALAGKLEALVIIAPPKSLGEMRKHYHSSLSAVLVGELAKDFSNHSMTAIAEALAAK